MEKIFLNMMFRLPFLYYVLSNFRNLDRDGWIPPKELSNRYPLGSGITTMKNILIYLMMINKLYLLEKDGKLSSYELDTKKIQEYIDGIRNNLTAKYFELERKCNRSEIPGFFLQRIFLKKCYRITNFFVKKVVYYRNFP